MERQYELATMPLWVRHVVGPLPVLPGKKEVYYNDLFTHQVVLSDFSLCKYTKIF